VLRIGLIAAACTVLGLTACGSGSHPTAGPKTKQCVSPRAIAKLNADIAALHHAKNSASINRATDRFLLAVATAAITNLKRNRMIDHAIGALGGRCEQCFQAFEAARPIPNIRTGARC
jgi:hypothetical protein